MPGSITSLDKLDYDLEEPKKVKNHAKSAQEVLENRGKPALTHIDGIGNVRKHKIWIGIIL